MKKELGWMFENSSLYDGYLKNINGKPDTFVITGGIRA
jgi:hypothetical protein